MGIKLIRYLTENTLFHALDSRRLNRDRAAYQRLSTIGKIQKGIFSEVIAFPKYMFFSFGTTLVVKKFVREKATQDVIGNLSNKKIILLTVVVMPVLEELIHRLCIQSILQRFLPNAPSTIFVANLPFVFVHSSLIQRINHLFFPAEAIAYETSRSVAVSIAIHSTHNLMLAIPLIAARTLLR